MKRGSLHRGELITVNVPYLDGSHQSLRPALVVCDPMQMLDLVIAMITSTIRFPLPSTHYLIDDQHSDWTRSGLRLPSAVRCDRLYTMEYDDIHRKIGSLSTGAMLQIDSILKLALGIQ